jgi:hypothetical protein
MDAVVLVPHEGREPILAHSRNRVRIASMNATAQLNIDILWRTDWVKY